MYSLDKFKLIVNKEEDSFGSYSLAPLPKGYGATVGNALRRILLSSIQGAAVTGIKINGIKHEYSSLPGVFDDIHTIKLRLKGLALKNYSKEKQVLKLSVSGKKVVTAKDIQLTGEVECFNPDYVITELTDKNAKLSIEMYVENGVGYHLADETKRSEIGLIPLDADFSPVLRVVLTITQARVGQQIDLDQINLDIYTDGSIKVRDAFNQAVEIYNNVTTRLNKLLRGEIKEEPVVKEAPVKKENSEDLDIDKLNLSARLTNGLLKSGYNNLLELEGMTKEQIMEIKGLGQKSVEELLETMNNYKLNIKD